MHLQIRGDETAQGEGKRKGSRKAPEPFTIFLFLHNINNNNVIVVLFNSFDILIW